VRAKRKERDFPLRKRGEGVGGFRIHGGCHIKRTGKALENEKRRKKLAEQRAVL